MSDGTIKAHLFICVNDRKGGRESCAEHNAQDLRDQVKKLCQEKNLPKGSYRVNNAGCLGRCEQGIVAVLYPKNEWFTNLRADDAELLASQVEKAVKGS